MLKSKKLFIAMLLTCFTTIAEAGCWWQWEGIKSTWVCDGLSNGGNSTIPVEPDTGIRLMIKNDCWDTNSISVSVFYKNRDDIWTGDGFWNLAPGETVTVGYTYHDYFYFHADGDGHEWKGDMELSVNGYDLFMRKRYHNGVVNLTCND
jgi:hypothetical protein